MEDFSLADPTSFSFTQDDLQNLIAGTGLFKKQTGGFFGDLGRGIEDVFKTDSAMLDDLSRMDFSGVEDRAEENLFTVMENPALRTVAMPVLDYFTFGLGSSVANAEYNKKRHNERNIDSDALEGMAANALTNYGFNQAGLTGTSNNTLAGVGQNVAVGAGKGAVSAGLQGESMTEGAKYGAIGAAVPSLGAYAGNTLTSPQTSSEQPFFANPNDPMAQYSLDTTQANPNDPMAMYALDKPENNTMYTTPAESKTSLGFSPEISQFISSIVPQTPERWGDLAGGLLSMYSGARRRRAAKEMMNQFGANRNAYGQQLQRNLLRKDAASGRRSNYGGREVELQARLAELDSRNAPAMAALNEAKYSGLDQMLRSGIRMGGNLGWFGAEPARPQAQFSMPVLPSLSPSLQTDYSLDPRRRARLGGDY